MEQINQLVDGGFAVTFALQNTWHNFFILCSLNSESVKINVSFNWNLILNCDLCSPWCLET